mmetsp:Transcript_27571/g.38961  ORF Transcript_27571/g.38961 Transcript_27571/m.38961 type:complete len:217 (-) Transcript_27571:699-1349(-)
MPLREVFERDDLTEALVVCSCCCIAHPLTVSLTSLFSACIIATMDASLSGGSFMDPLILKSPKDGDRGNPLVAIKFWVKLLIAGAWRLAGLCIDPNERADPMDRAETPETAEAAIKLESIAEKLLLRPEMVEPEEISVGVKFLPNAASSTSCPLLPIISIACWDMVLDSPLILERTFSYNWPGIPYILVLFCGFICWSCCCCCFCCWSCCCCNNCW